MPQPNSVKIRLIQSFPKLMNLLHIQHPPEVWASKWEKTIALYKDEEQLYFLSNDFITEANSYFKLNEEQMDAFNYALDLIRGREDLRTLAWLWKLLLYDECDQSEAYDIANWPLPEAAMGASAKMFPLIVAVSNLPWLIEYYKNREISEDILYDTLSDIGVITEESRRRTGFWGIENSLLEWLLNHFHGRLFRIGRLQYIPKRYDQSVVVYRHLEGSTVIALEGESLIEQADYVEGTPITPQGKVLSQRVKLSCAEWEAALTQGDFLLDVHIPRGDKLDYDQVSKSYQSAMDILPKLFPEYRFKGYICNTWMFDPLLREILSKSSNLVKFQSDFYLYRVVDDDSVFETVFVKKTEDLHALPEETSLQRAIKRHVLSGKQMRSAAGFLLFDDLNKGPAYYQEQQSELGS